MTVESLMQAGLGSQPLAAISVGDFFSQINWHGETSLTSEAGAEADNPYETVGQFFATFPWQGTTQPMPSGEQDELADHGSHSMGNDTLTLEDLSALF